MTKKDYEIIAHAIKEIVESENLDGYVNGENITVNEKQIKITMNAFADYLSTFLSRQNPRFNYDKFMKASGV